MKVLLRNTLNDFCLENLFIFSFQVPCIQTFVSIWVKRLRYFLLIEAAFFDYLYFEACFLEFLVVTNASVNRGEQGLIRRFHLDNFLILN